MAGAAAGVAGVLVIGARKGKYGADGSINAIPGANLPLATLGTFILWLGWFGFNGGSVLATASVADATAVANVFMNTNAAAAGGCIAALLVAKAMFGKADLTMALNGCLAGLVAITAEPSTPTALQATIFGALGGVLVVFSIVTLDKLKFDDPVGAVSVHGVVGLLGLLLVLVTNDDPFGQLIGAATIFGWVFITSFIAFKAIGFVLPYVYPKKRSSKALTQEAAWKLIRISTAVVTFQLVVDLGDASPPFFVLKNAQSKPVIRFFDQT